MNQHTVLHHPGLSRRGLLGGMLGLAFASALPRCGVARGLTVDAGAFGAVGDGRADATAALNAAARAVPAGGVLHVPPGRYRITHPVLLHTGTTLAGPGATLFATEAWQSPHPGRDRTKRWKVMVANLNHAAADIQDHDITVRDIHFQYVGTQDGEAHAVEFRMARKIVVDSCSFSGGGNATAFLACRETEVVRCISQGTLNCAFDHWEGTSDGLVHQCVATCARGYGILFTGAGTEKAHHAHAARLSAIGNRIYTPSAAGIWICSLSEESVVSEVVVRDNLVRGGPFKAAGIGATGRVRDILIENNRIEDVKGHGALFSRPDKWGRPSGVRILRNRIARCTVDDAAIALIQALGDGIEVRGNRALASDFPSLAWVDGRDVVLADNGGSQMRGKHKYRMERAITPMISDP